MRFYHATNRIFPRNYGARMFALCFGATHIPLVVFLIFQLLRGTWDWGLFLAVLAATLAGSVLALGAIWGLLSPIDEATRALTALREGDVSRDIPIGGPDMAGQLLESVALAARSTKERLEMLEGQATTDLLTGLPNRRGFIEQLGKLDAEQGTLVVLDGDRFKRINDTYGHVEGDRVLRAMAQRIASMMTDSDLAARWGGDEFVLFMASCSRTEATYRMEKLRYSMRRRPLARVEGAPVSFAFGMTTFTPASAESVDAAIERADKELYVQKDAARTLA